LQLRVNISAVLKVMKHELIGFLKAMNKSSYDRHKLNTA